MRHDLYISLDVECDGPIPGPYSMLSVGACVAGLHTERGFARITPLKHPWYLELQPISGVWVPEALAVAEQGLTLSRSELVADGTDPAGAMADLVAWVKAREADYDARAVAVGWPVAWDFGTWVYWYLIRYAGLSPFSHGQARDIRDAYCHKAGVPIRAVGKRDIPAGLRPAGRHTHNGLDDAMEQAELFANIMEWTP